MKRRINKRTISIILSVAMVASSLLPAYDTQAKKAPKLSATKLSLKVGQKKALKVKYCSKKVKWSVATGKSFIKLVNVKKTSVKVQGKKAGSAKIKAKAGKKIFFCNVKVAKSVSSKTDSTPIQSVKPVEQQTTPSVVVTSKPAEETKGPGIIVTSKPAEETKSPSVEKEVELTKKLRVDLGISNSGEIEILPTYEQKGVLYRIIGIAEDAFSGSSLLTSVVIPEGVTSIEKNAFSNCEKLSKVILPKSLTWIGESAFSGCSSLSDVKLPKDLKYIEEYAFSGCNLESVDIPQGITELPAGVFNMTSLDYISIPRSVVDIVFGSTPNDKTSSLPVFDANSKLEISWMGKVYNVYADGYVNYSEFIHDFYAEGGEEDPTSPPTTNPIIIIPTLPPLPSVTAEPTSAPTANPIIIPTLPPLPSATEESTTVPTTEPTVEPIVEPTDKPTIDEKRESGLYSEDGEQLYSWRQLVDYRYVSVNAEGCLRECSYSDNYPGEKFELVIDQRVTSIGAYAFGGCTALTGVVLPEGITSIGTSAFRGCTELTSVVLPEGVTSIGTSAFRGCTELTSVVLPEGVTSIGESAFNGCTALSSIEIPEGVTSIDNSVFEGCTALTSIEIPDGVASIGDSAFYDCINLPSIEIPDSVASIGDYAFYRCAKLKSIIVPNSVIWIGIEIFKYCDFTVWWNGLKYARPEDFYLAWRENKNIKPTSMQLSKENATDWSVTGDYAQVTFNEDGTVDYCTDFKEEHETSDGVMAKGSVYNNGVAFYVEPESHGKVDVRGYDYFCLKIKTDAEVDLLTWSGGLDAESFYDKVDVWGKVEKTITNDDGSKTLVYKVSDIFSKPNKALAVGFALKATDYVGDYTGEEPYATKTAKAYDFTFTNTMPTGLPVPEITESPEESKAPAATKDPNALDPSDPTYNVRWKELPINESFESEDTLADPYLKKGIIDYVSEGGKTGGYAVVKTSSWTGPTVFLDNRFSDKATRFVVSAWIKAKDDEGKFKEVNFWEGNTFDGDTASQYLASKYQTICSRKLNTEWEQIVKVISVPKKKFLEVRVICPATDYCIDDMEARLLAEGEIEPTMDAEVEIPDPEDAITKSFTMTGDQLKPFEGQGDSWFVNEDGSVTVDSGWKYYAIAFEHPVDLSKFGSVKLNGSISDGYRMCFKNKNGVFFIGSPQTKDEWKYPSGFDDEATIQFEGSGFADFLILGTKGSDGDAVTFALDSIEMKELAAPIVTDDITAISLETPTKPINKPFLG